MRCATSSPLHGLTLNSITLVSRIKVQTNLWLELHVSRNHCRSYFYYLMNLLQRQNFGYNRHLFWNHIKRSSPKVPSSKIKSGCLYFNSQTRSIGPRGSSCWAPTCLSIKSLPKQIRICAMALPQKRKQLRIFVLYRMKYFVAFNGVKYVTKVNH